MEPMIRVYASEQVNTRRPGVRLVCTCGWGVVAAHAGEARPLAAVIDTAMRHASEAHGIDEIRGEATRNGPKPSESLLLPSESLLLPIDGDR